MVIGMENQIRTDREYEEGFYSEVDGVVRSRCEALEDTIKKTDSEILEMKKMFDCGELEQWSLVEEAITANSTARSSLKREARVLKKPYFGRILFDDESLYIGRSGIHRSNITDQLVADWRAPIANAYYENGMGEVKFRTPTGEEVKIDLKLKRTFDIENGRLVDYFDSETTANDDLLNKYLARNKQAVLGEIIATIQKEQNDIIRLTPRHNVLVQGAAGSGKTTVAMHRISYILYNFADTVRPQDFYIIGSNKMLLNYITGVLPDLDVTGFRQMTMEEMFTRLLYEDWNPILYRIKDINKEGINASIKGTSLFFDKLKAFLDEYEQKVLKQEDVMLDPNQFVEGLENGRSGIYDRRNNPVARKGKAVCILRGNAIKSYIRSNPNISLQNKIIALNKEIIDNIESEFAGKPSYTEREKKKIISVYGKYFGDKDFKGSIFSIYDDFVRTVSELDVPAPAKKLVTMPVTGGGARYNTGKTKRNNSENLENIKPERIINSEEDLDRAVDNSSDGQPEKYIKKYVTEYDIYELTALAYIYKRVKETQTISEAHHIVIDEAQDYGIMAYRVLKECIRECTYTIMGDVSQNIRYDSGINDWSELRELYLTTPYDSFMMLRKSYRNTVEISEFATGILDHGDFEVYPVEPIIRHGDAPKLMKVEAADMIDEIVKQCRSWQQEELLTIAIVCSDEKEEKGVREALKGKLELIDTDTENPEFGNGIMVLPVALTKGLEFDAVLIYEPTKKAYPADNRHAKYLYVAATRALHRLTVMYSKSLTDLIAKPVPVDKVRHVLNPEGPERPSEEEVKAFEEKKRLLLEADEQDSKQRILDEAARRTRKYLEGRKGASKANADALNGNQQASGANADVPDPDRNHRASSANADVPDRNPQASNANADAPDRNPQASNANVGAARYTSIEFIKEVPGELLRPSGHPSNSFATRWIQKKKDGIYLQSLYGVTRISPIAQNIVRISFSAGLELKTAPKGSVKEYQPCKDFQYKENPQSVEITLKGMSVRYDRYRGACTFYDSGKRELLKENQNEPRYIDLKKSRPCTFTNFACTSADTFHILSPKDGNMKFLKDTAYYISPGEEQLPCIIKKDKYAIIPVTASKTAFCRMNVVGSFLMQEDAFSDYYLLVADTTERLVEMYHKLAARPTDK